jgi:outer membrane protein, heavy metal efflux system
MNPRVMLHLVSISILSACASVSPEDGFRDVKALAAQRGVEHVHWNQGTQADADAAQAVRELLQHELTADTAVEIALLENHNLQATLEELGIAQADLVQAGLLSNPVFRGEVRFPASPVNPVELDLMQDFLELLMLPLRKRVAEAQLEAVKLRVANSVLMLASETRADFYVLQGADQLLEMRRTIVAAAEAAADAAQRLHDAGNTTDLDLANEQALLAQARIELASAEEMVLDLREKLTTAMGLWGEDVAVTVPARLPDLPFTEIDAAHMESLAVSQRLDLAAAQADVESFAQAAGLSNYQAFLPGVSLGAHLQREPDGTTTLGPAIEIPIPIFDQGRPAKARAGALLRQSEQRFAALAVEVRSEVRRARNHMLSARRRTEYGRTVLLPLRQKILEETQLRYNGMLVGIFQLLRAKEAEIEAGRDYIEALRDYWVSRTELEHAVGGRIPEVEVGAKLNVHAPDDATPQEKSADPEIRPEHQHGN